MQRQKTTGMSCGSLLKRICQHDKHACGGLFDKF